MAEARRIPVQEAREKTTAGRALLVCAYEDDAKCNKIRLEGAISLADFERKLPTLSKDQGIIFYCA